MALEIWVDNKSGVKCRAKHPLERKGECIVLKPISILRKHELFSGQTEYPAECSPLHASHKGRCKAGVSQQWRMAPFGLCSSGGSAEALQLSKTDLLDFKWYLNARWLPEAHWCLCAEAFWTFHLLWYFEGCCLGSHTQIVYFQIKHYWLMSV